MRAVPTFAVRFAFLRATLVQLNTQLNNSLVRPARLGYEVSSFQNYVSVAINANTLHVSAIFTVKSRTSTSNSALQKYFYERNFGTKISASFPIFDICRCSSTIYF